MKAAAQEEDAAETGGEEITQKNNVIMPKASANTLPKNSSRSFVTNIWLGSTAQLVESWG